MNMINTDTTEYAKVTKHTAWQEVVPFLRTGDIVTVHFRTGETEFHTEVWVNNETQLITVGPRLLRWPNGTLNSNVTDVALHSACVQADDLEPLAASLKAGDVVRATFVYTGSSAITLEGTVLTDEDDDALLVVEDEDPDEDGDDREIYYLTFHGRIADNLRALEVIDPNEDTEGTKGADLSAERVAELRKLATSLKDGDVVRAAFIDRDAAGDDLVVTREGPVTLDADGDPFLVQGCEPYHLAWYGAPVRDLRTLEVIDPDEDADMGLPPEPEPLPVHQMRLQPDNGYAWQKLPHGWECAQLAEYLTDDDVRSWPVIEIIAPAGDDKDIEEIIEDITGEEHTMDMSTPEGRLAAFKATPLGTRVSATYAGFQFKGVLALDSDEDFAIDIDGGEGYLRLTSRGAPRMSVQDITFREDEAPLTFAAYAARAAETAVYPGQGTFWGLQYVTAGLASEAGEVLGKITKMQRDGYTPDSTHIWGDDRDDIIAELGDVAWYLAMACREVGIDPDEVLTRNMAKLADRAARDTIQGSGDNR